MVFLIITFLLRVKTGDFFDFLRRKIVIMTRIMSKFVRFKIE